MRMRNKGFTIVEVITVLVIILILGVILLPTLSHMADRAEKLNCTSNLKTLHGAAVGYLQDNRQWPQIPMTKAHDENFAKAWINALSKYGVHQKSWLCPTIQRGLGNPVVDMQKNFRVDYIGMTFDSKEGTPYRWANMPWFLEKSAPHGRGNLLIYSSGRVEELSQVKMVH
jgi:prepilin-type N-terminal cleavage/methylation domain-containing protein